MSAYENQPQQLAEFKDRLIDEIERSGLNALYSGVSENRLEQFSNNRNTDGIDEG